MSYRPKLSSTSPERFGEKEKQKKRAKAAKRVLTGKASETVSENQTIRLNKYISRSGICSRRDADELIKEGKVKVNGIVVTEMGHQVLPADKVQVNDNYVQPENFVYVLLNKPTNTITTTEDEKGRNTVMDLVEEYTGHRLYPVGRLDRNTTGLLLLTNDGDLANRLMHPSYSVTKVYEATCDRIFSDDELKQLVKGVELEDGMAKAVKAERHEDHPNIVILSVHEGRNHLVKRMIAALGAEVIRLKRTQYAILYIDKLRSGRWRYLKAFEVNKLRTSVKLPEMKFTKG